VKIQVEFFAMEMEAANSSEHLYPSIITTECQTRRPQLEYTSDG